MIQPYDPFLEAQRHLLLGFPGRIQCVGDGDYFDGYDSQTGLPRVLIGDNSPDIPKMDLYNKGVIAFIGDYGMPWNTRLEWRDAYENLPEYVEARSRDTFELKIGGQPFEVPGGFSRVRLILGSRNRLHLIHEGERFFKVVSWAAREGPLPAYTAPSFVSGTAEIWLRFMNEARKIECVPLPARSRLLAFRFSDFGLMKEGSSKLETRYCILDLDLNDWIPAYGAVSWENYRSSWMTSDRMAARKTAAARAAQWPIPGPPLL